MRVIMPYLKILEMSEMSLANIGAKLVKCVTWLNPILEQYIILS